MSDPTAPYATLADIASRYPRELAVVAADEKTGVRDDIRINAVLGDVTTELRSYLIARYRKDELTRLDDDSRALLRTYAIAMALYRIPMSFSRSAERFQTGYDNALRALQALGAGKAALTFDPDPTALPASPGPGEAVADNTTVLLEANERMFTRARTRGL